MCHFTPLVLLLFPSWVLDVVVLDVVDIDLMLLFEAMPQINMAFFLKKSHMDH